MTTPLLSVVLPVHTAARYIRQAYESLLSQTFQDFEIIVVDDGSRDESIEIIESYGDLRTSILRQEKQGIAAALNRGIQRARGRFIGRMDADDLSLAHRFEKQISYLLAHPEVGVVGSDYYEIDSNGRIVALWHVPHSHEAIQRALMKRNPMGHPSVVIRRELFDVVGGYESQWIPIEDWHLWLRMIGVTRFANLAEPLLQWRVHPESTTDRQRSVQVKKGIALRLEAVRRNWAPKSSLVYLLKPMTLMMLPLSFQRQLLQFRKRNFDIYVR